MNLYKCDDCKKEFKKKSNYDDHRKRQKSCKDDIMKKHKCQYCKKIYCRIDSLNRHINTIHADIINDKRINVKKSKNKGQINTGKINGSMNNNNITINLMPFGKYEENYLTTPEKIAIFSSKMNPIEMIIIKTHLNPNKKQYHNVGITDIQSGYGIIYDGKK